MSLPPCVTNPAPFDAVLDLDCGKGERRTIVEDAARLVCATCPLEQIRRCLTDVDNTGVIGGYTLEQRRRIARGEKVTLRKPRKQPVRLEFTEEERRRGHTDYTRGERDMWTVEANRAYHRVNQRLGRERRRREREAA